MIEGTSRKFPALRPELSPGPPGYLENGGEIDFAAFKIQYLDVCPAGHRIRATSPATSAGPIRRPHRIASHRVAVSKYMPPIDHDPSVRGRRSGWARLGDKCSAYVRTRSLAMHGGKGEDAEPGGTDHCEYCA